MNQCRGGGGWEALHYRASLHSDTVEDLIWISVEGGGGVENHCTIEHLQSDTVEHLIWISVEGSSLEDVDARESVASWFSQGQRSRRPNYRSWPSGGHVTAMEDIYLAITTFRETISMCVYRHVKSSLHVTDGFRSHLPLSCWPLLPAITFTAGIMEDGFPHLTSLCHKMKHELHIVFLLNPPSKLSLRCWLDEKFTRVKNWHEAKGQKECVCVCVCVCVRGTVTSCDL